MMTSQIWLYARIIVNAVFLVLDLCGIKASASSLMTKRTIGKVAKFIEMSPDALKAVEKFISALIIARGKENPWEMAKAIFQLIRDLQAFGIVWMIIESLCSEMGRWDWAMTALQVSLAITGTFTTGGLALTTKIAGAALSAKALIDLIKSVILLKTFS